MIRELTELSEHRAAAELLTKVWSRQLIDPGLITALSRSGNYVGGLVEGGELLGAAVGFFGADGELHSHVLGVLPGARGGGAGLRLKLHQRDWALARGVSIIRWTFDPLVRRNAHFNITRLGALPCRYVPDYYGPMADEINAGDRSDRFLVEWDLTGAPPPEPELLELSGTVVRQGETLFVRVPEDIEALRRNDPAAANRWRMAVRAAMADAQESGFRVTGMSRSGWYVLTSGGTS
ncbi:GNAT family N-acetyltransferase [Kutzneria albida]|uniref:N-acetyltransferase domain-containing protein n=1 Tax=Kutzneria albida DSM 43870 TaxID=1449976 RepID=W5W4J1_9PSEU|nr:GNAT family N-acetyltransferase [Kutzneria albida]AHH95685.1 hypothetical protein KALB_2317 [Kutzneria albida DSM 43870]